GSSSRASGTPPSSTSRSRRPSSSSASRRTDGRPSGVGVQALEGVSRRLALTARLRDGPAPGGAVDGENGPAAAVFVAEVHEQRVAVVLDAQTVGVVALLAEDARALGGAVGDERGPARGSASCHGASILTRGPPVRAQETTATRRCSA